MNKKIRVVLGTIYPFDEIHIRGGVESVALYLARALSSHEDIELHVVSFNRQVHRETLEQRSNIAFHWLPAANNFYMLRAATTYPWKLRQLYRQIAPDIIHAQGFSEYAVAARATDILLLTIHGVEVFAPAMKNMPEFRGIAGLYRRMISLWIVRQSLWRARIVISIAGNYTRTVLGNRLQGKQVVDIFNPIADEFFSLMPAVPHQSPIILAAGTIIHRKNFLSLIRSFHQVLDKVPEAELRIAGSPGDIAYFQQMQKLVIDLGIAQHVHFLGGLDEPHLLQEYKACSVFALSSIQETAPMVVGQAMAAGKPVVATRVGGIPWMVEDRVSGYLVNVDDVKGTADCIIRILEDDTARCAMGKAARARAIQLFDPNIVAEQTVKAYRNLMEENRDSITAIGK